MGNIAEPPVVSGPVVCAALRRRWRIVGMAFEPPVMESVDWKWFRTSSLTWDELRRAML